MLRTIKLMMLSIVAGLCICGVSFGASNILLTGLELNQAAPVSGVNSSGEYSIFQFSAPELKAVLINYGPDDLFAGAQVVGNQLQTQILNTGYITCQDSSTTPATVLYQSAPANSFLVQANTQQVLTNITLPNTITQVAGTLIDLECTFDFNNEFNLDPSSVKTATIKLRVQEASPGRFDVTLGLARDPIKEKLDVAIPQR